MKPKPLSPCLTLLLLFGVLLAYPAQPVRTVGAASPALQVTQAPPLTATVPFTPTPAPNATPTPTPPVLLPTPPPILQIDPRAIAHDLIPRLINTVLILIAGWIFTILTRRLVFNMFGRLQREVQIFITRLVYLTIWILAILWTLSVFQVPATTLAAVIGTVGLALGLASQDLVKNFIAGLYLLIERPFRVGDEITISTFTGKVDYIDLRTTIVTTTDNQQVIVPNTMILSQVVVINKGGTVVKAEEAPPKKTK